MSPQAQPIPAGGDAGMPFELSVDQRGAAELHEKLAAFGVRLRRALVRAVDRAALRVEARAKQLVSGEVLRVRTGTLRRSIASRTEELPDRVRGIVSASARYARIHELGGTVRIPEVRPRRKQALHFFVGGREVFAMRARAHDVKIPERPYLRRALRETGPEIRAELRQAVLDAAAPGGVRREA